jgi:hypothetical protein
MNAEGSESVNVSAVNAMVWSIESYRGGSVPLHQLVNDLETALKAMLQVPIEWRSRFWQSWAALEEINAVALDAGHTCLPADNEQVVIKSLRAIEELITEARSTFAG